MKSTNIRRENGVAILMPRTDLVGGPESHELETLLMKFATWGKRQIIVDLQRVSILNSAGLRLLEQGQAAYAECGGLFRLCGVTTRNREFIERFALVQTLEPFETIDDAIESLGDERDEFLKKIDRSECPGEAVYSD